MRKKNYINSKVASINRSIDDIGHTPKSNFDVIRELMRTAKDAHAHSLNSKIVIGSCTGHTK